MRKDKVGQPKEMKADVGRSKKSTTWCYNENRMFVSYADESKKETKVVLLLSTMHDEVHVSRDTRWRPPPFTYHGHMKSGVNDACLTMLSIISKSKRWVIDFYLIR